MLTQYMHPGSVAASLTALLWPLAKQLRPLFLTLLLALIPAPISAQQSHKGASAGLERIRSYVSDGWKTLSLTLSDCAALSDANLNTATQLYLPADVPVPESSRYLE